MLTTLTLGNGAGAGSADAAGKVGNAEEADALAVGAGGGVVATAVLDAVAAAEVTVGGVVAWLVGAELSAGFGGGDDEQATTRTEANNAARFMSEGAL